MAANFFGPFTEIAPHTVTVSLPTLPLSLFSALSWKLLLTLSLCRSPHFHFFSALSWKFLPTLCRCPLAKYLLSPLTLGEKAKVKI